MYTSLLAIVFTTHLAAAQGADPLTWTRDYAKAQQTGIAQSKPLAVVLGSGAQGWNQLAREGSLNQETQNLLQSHYVPVFLDTATPEGKRLAEAFQIASGKGLILSDRQGQTQAFWHDGDLAGDVLAKQLHQFGPGLASRTSYYTATILSGVATTPYLRSTPTVNC